MAARQLKASESGDLVITEDKLEVIDGQASILQSIVRRLYSIRGAWRYDLNDGVPYYEDIMGVKNPNLELIAAIFREVILETPGVTSVRKCEVVVQSRTDRTYRVNAEVLADDSIVVVNAPIDIRRDEF